MHESIRENHFVQQNTGILLGIWTAMTAGPIDIFTHCTVKVHALFPTYTAKCLCLLTIAISSAVHSLM